MHSSVWECAQALWWKRQDGSAFPESQTFPLQICAHAQGPELAIHHGEAVLAAMNEWSEKQHGASGLTQRCRESTVGMREAEDQARPALP